MLKKIISGGQTGADQGALFAASKFQGIETGGFIGKFFETEDGPNPTLARFGLVELVDGGYRKRTRENVRISDATLYFVRDFDSPGLKCTRAAASSFRRRMLLISVQPCEIPPYQIAQWIAEGQISVLNVAGNRESKSPGIQAFTEQYMTEVLQRLGFRLKPEQET